MKKLITIILLVSIFLFSCSAKQCVPSEQEKMAKYYNGVFDTCMATIPRMRGAENLTRDQRVDMCTQLLDKAVSMDWYHNGYPEQP